MEEILKGRIHTGHAHAKLIDKDRPGDEITDHQQHITRQAKKGVFQNFFTSHIISYPKQQTD